MNKWKTGKIEKETKRRIDKCYNTTQYQAACGAWCSSYGTRARTMMGRGGGILAQDTYPLLRRDLRSLVHRLRDQGQDHVG